MTAAGQSALGSTFLPDRPNQAAVLPRLRERGARYLPELAHAPLTGMRTCARPITPDGRPLIGAVPGIEGAFLAAGQQVDFAIKPTESRKYTIETKGASDTLLTLFEDIKSKPRFLAGDDDSGEDRNASVTYKLFKERRYIVRLRLYYPGQSGKTSVMYS